MKGQVKGISVGSKIKCRQSGELGTIIRIINRGEILVPLFKVTWDDEALGGGDLFEHEFEVTEEE